MGVVDWFPNSEYFQNSRLHRRSKETDLKKRKNVPWLYSKRNREFHFDSVFFFTLLCCFYLLTNRSTCKTLVHGIKTLNLWKTKIPDQATIWFGQF